MAHTPKIAIVGGGPAGLTLARILQQSHVSATVFEAEPSRTARQQGGSLDLHVDSGQLALHAAGLYDQFLKLVRPGADAMRVSDPSGVLLHDECPEDGRTPDGPPRGPPPGQEGGDGGPPSDERPEVDRIALRGVLLDSLAEGTVRWGAKLREVIPEPAAPAQFNLEFTSGAREGPFDLVVGADGAWSRVRPLIHDEKPYYSGVGGLEVRLRDVDARNPEMGKLVGAGSYFAFGEGKVLLAQRNGDASVRVYALRLAPERWLYEDSGYNWKDQRSKDVFAATEFSGWAPPQRDLILKADEDILLRNLYMLPVGIRWVPKPGLTLIGDAAHLMTPFAGEGVNLAMKDAMTLAAAIVAALTPAADSSVADDVSARLAGATATFEAQMFEYALGKARETEGHLKSLFGPGGAQAMLAAMGPPPEGEGGEDHP